MNKYGVGDDDILNFRLNTYDQMYTTYFSGEGSEDADGPYR